MRIIIARSQESYHEDEIEGDPEDADEVSHLPLVNLVLLLISFACLPMPGCCSWPAMLPLFLTMDQRSSSRSVPFLLLTMDQRSSGLALDVSWTVNG